MRAEKIAVGIPFGEGPVWCPDGTLVVTSVSGGALYRVWPESGRTHRFAETLGGANGAALAADGSFLVTQNGGIDFSAFAFLFPDGPPPPNRPTTPGLQLVQPDGTVELVLERGFHAPNDLAVAPDGTVWFTDPPHYPPPQEGLVGRVWAWHPPFGRDDLELVADGFWLCNGIAVEPAGTVVVVERTGLQRLRPEGPREWVVEHLGRGGGDGFCLDVDGRFYVASSVEHGVRVIDDGREVDFLEIPGDGVTTNCCFGGPDGRWLFATDAVPGDVVVWDAMPTPGLALTPWPGFGSGGG